MTEDEMVEWHHRLHGHEFEQTIGDEGQGSLACCSPWGHKESDMTERLNNRVKTSVSFLKTYFHVIGFLWQLFSCRLLRFYENVFSHFVNFPGIGKPFNLQVHVCTM